MPLRKFDKNILSLSLRANFTKSKYPNFYEFYSKYPVSRTYYSHLFKCSEHERPWHEPPRCVEILSFGEPIPKDTTNGSVKYMQGSDPSEKFLPSKLENPTNLNHGMLFTRTTQTALNMDNTVKCSECCKRRAMCAKKSFLMKI